MHTKINALIEKIQRLEEELEAELTKRQADMSFTIQNQKIIFEQEVIRRHKQFKTRLSTYTLGARPLMFITAPVIYALIVPFVLLDGMVTLYQWICFPVYGLEKVKRADYFIYDRHHLAYLNLLEKFNCAYCAYGNGLIAYVREVASRTEAYWCPIKHASRVHSPHARYRQFIDYGDAERYHAYLEKIKEELKAKQHEES